jgi:hypothetical protein
MTVTPQPAAAYGNLANATLAFEVAGAALTVDTETGNQVAATEVINYLATLRLNRGRWEKQVGVDESTFPCTGRLLSPATLDPRIVGGSKAAAVINGRRGRFELQEDLGAPLGAIPLLRQEINGTFRVTGGRGDG